MLLRILVLFLIASSLQAADYAAHRLRYTRASGAEVVMGHGSAVALDLSEYGLVAPRHMLTAAHNVAGATNISVEIGGEWVGAQAVASDAGLDLCVLECNVDLPRLDELAQAEPAIEGRVVLAGSKRGAVVTIHDGTLKRKYYRGYARSLIGVAFDHGDSGAPVYDGTGAVIGIAVAGIPAADGDMEHGTGLYVPLAAVRAFLENVKSNHRISR